MKNTVLTAVVASVAGFVGFWLYAQLSRQDHSFQSGALMTISEEQLKSPSMQAALEEMKQLETMRNAKK